jgi:sn-glycerol 3-phosphate transport system permease protein
VTSGCPARAAEILVYKVYRDRVEGLNLGGSLAQSVILMLIVIALRRAPCAVPILPRA